MESGADHFRWGLIAIGSWGDIEERTKRDWIGDSIRDGDWLHNNEYGKKIR